ncbi:transposase [Nocardia sp. NPDC059246]|uniref:transposase n=1 Tax=unclassified Nocardia TaxID=2637762 RepID=UPI00367FC64D
MLDDVVAEDVSAWRSGFDEVFAPVAGAFYRAEPRRRVRAYLTGLLAPVERKNSWRLSEAAGVVEPGGLQHFLNRSRWGAEELRDRLRSYVAEALAGPDGVLLTTLAHAFPAVTDPKAHAGWAPITVADIRRLLAIVLHPPAHWHRGHQAHSRNLRYQRKRLHRNKIQLSC